MRRMLLWAAFACMLASGDGHAATTIIYRCTDAAGAVTFQNGTACPAGHRQERRVVEMATPMPTYVPPPARPVRAPQVPLISQLPVVETPDGTGGDVSSEPPPPLFACRVFDNSTYWREDDTPPLRCRPMQTVGIGGLPGLGAGEACEQVTDVCEAVPDDALCRSWETRVREAEFRWRYAQGRAQDPLRREYEDVFATWRDSSCGPAGDAASAQNQRGTDAR